MSSPTPAVSAAMGIAIAHHNAGRLELAADHYRQVLLAAPQHSEAMRLLGLVALQSGDAAAAMASINRALATPASSALP